MADVSLYKVLGVHKNASNAEIKKAYQKLARECHPDKSREKGDKFKEISFAYDVLSNPEKKEIYDRFGMKGLKEGACNRGSIFSSMFDGQLGDFLGFPGTGSMRCRRQRGKSTFHPLHVSLEDLYKGKTAKLQLSKTVMCMKCNGAGSKSGVTMRCNVCNGRGVKVTIRQLGPGMVQQMQSVCHDCHGEGEVISDKDRCRECAGKKVVQETKVLEVHVDKGMKHEQKITFSGEGDQLPDVEPGDVVIVLQQLDHNVFTREGNNLLMTKTIPLTEALCGLQFVVHHLDGRDLVVSSQLGEVIKPGMVKTILEEGFPQYRCPYEKGDLVIKFDVAFPPKNFTDLDHLQMLETLLGSRDPAETPTGDHVEEVNMMDYEDARHTDGDNRGEAYHSDDEDVNGRRAHGPAGVECATQ